MKKLILIICIVNFGSVLPAYSEKTAHGAGKNFVSDQLRQNLATSDTGQKPTPQPQYFTQKLDHFSPSDKREWQQRYWKSEEFYKPNGPVFLWINDEGEADAGFLMDGQMAVCAKNLGALGFVLEHRYFGDSKPTKDTSTENLLYLNSEQVIEDVAEFIKGMNALNKLPSQTKWIAFGASYGASLAAWARMRHQDLIYGAVASSAPLLAILDFSEYYRSIQSTLAAYNEKCPKAIQDASEAIRVSFGTDAGRKSLTQMFRLCSEISNNPIDLTNLFAGIVLNIATVVQYNKDNRDSPTRSITIDKICDLLIRDNVPPLTSFVEVNKLMFDAYGTTCLDSTYQKAIEPMKKIEYETAAESGRLWFYQSCTEFGYMQTSSQPTDLFGVNLTLDFWVQECADIFGKKFDRKFLDDAIAHTNKHYGGLEINVSNTVFVHGSVDPYHTLGITEAKPGKLYDVVYIQGGAHCSDIYTPSTEDSSELKAAREKILNLLRSWVTT